MSRRVFIAVPTYSGQITAEAADSHDRARDEAAALGVEVTIRRRARDSLLARCRNALVQEFLNSGADDLLFWDDDVEVAPGAFGRLLSHPVDFVAGAYRFKADAEAYPIRPLEGGWREENGLVEVACATTGFLRVTRPGVERLIAAYPELWIRDRELGRVPWLFDCEIRDHELWGEDFTLCRRWRDIGGRVWIDQDIGTAHHGHKRHAGTFGHWLGRQLAARETPESLDAARDALVARATQ